MSAISAAVTRALSDPVHGAQQTFRALLEAMSRPGRLQELPARALHGIEAPPPLGLGTAAALLTLLDAETSVCLAGAMASEPVRAWLRFHCGVREAAAACAAFFVVDAAHAGAAHWSALDAGSDEAPQRGATLIVEVPRLGADGEGLALRLHGPGIESTHRLVVAGLAPAFWQTRERQRAMAPRGIDLILVAGSCIAALPRSTMATVEE